MVEWGMTEQIHSPETPSASPNQAPLAPPMLPFHMKATTGLYLRRLGMWRFAIALLLTVFIWLRFGFVAWVIFMVTIALIIGLIFFSYSRRSLLVDENGVEYRNALGQVKRARFDEIKEVAALLGYVELNFGPSPRVVALKNDGTILFSIVALHWKTNEVDALIAALVEKKVDVKSSDLPIDGITLAKQMPTYTHWHERHLVLTTLIGVFIAAIVIAIVAYFITIS